MFELTMHKTENLGSRVPPTCPVLLLRAFNLLAANKQTHVNVIFFLGLHAFKTRAFLAGSGIVDGTIRHGDN